MTRLAHHWSPKVKGTFASEMFMYFNQHFVVIEGLRNRNTAGAVKSIFVWTDSDMLLVRLRIESNMMRANSV